MAVYLANTGLEVLMKDGGLDQKQLLKWYGQSKRIPAMHGSYHTLLLDSGLELIFRAVPQGEDVQIVGLDMHMSGKCVWTARPLARVGIGEPLFITLLLTNSSETSAFIADIVHAATIEQMEENQKLSMQVCAFPQALDVYDSRSSYEAAVEESGRLEDKKLLPFNYIMAREEHISEKQKEQYSKHEKMMLFCGPVLSVAKREHGFENASCMVATIATEMGHLDLVYAQSQLSSDLTKGSYVVGSCIISADIIVD